MILVITWTWSIFSASYSHTVERPYIMCIMSHHIWHEILLYMAEKALSHFGSKIEAKLATNLGQIGASLHVGLDVQWAPNFVETLLIPIPIHPERFRIIFSTLKKLFIFVHFGHYMNLEHIFGFVLAYGRETIYVHHVQSYLTRNIALCGRKSCVPLWLQNWSQTCDRFGTNWSQPSCRF